ncbi:MAG: glutamine-hydrolyzing carbamoyl-phosphate synthase small subunit [Opitutales bacterium]|nr:glutamine-hydrolyzing carbamoyl-phosphate synthase small subunit [Opitutales bacterium]
MQPRKKAILALEDGSVYEGIAFGGNGTVCGEAVFNTSMTGYQELLTDPSYFGQIVTMTAPQIGNYGVNPEDEESTGPKVSGFVVRELSPVASNWRSRQSLDEYLRINNIPGIQGVDTRAITKRLRVHGALKACLTTQDMTAEEAVKKAREWVGLVGQDYVSEVTCKEISDWDLTGDQSIPFMVEGTHLNQKEKVEAKHQIVAFDCGAKLSIYRRLRNHGFTVKIVPAKTSAEEIKEMNPDGVFLSNGPGDPSTVTYLHQALTKLIPEFPVFGICMGHQMLTHALGGSTYKLKFGHRGGNQPVKNLETGKVSITSQNHGFATDAKSIEKGGGVVTEINLNDQTVEGLKHRELPVFSVQYHPEAAPGPNDADPLFHDFYQLIEQRKAGKI